MGMGRYFAGVHGYMSEKILAGSSPGPGAKFWCIFGCGSEFLDP